jgi:hypothetical protein
VDDKIKKEMGRAYGMYVEGKDTEGYSWGILREEDHLEDLGIVERML